jgi:hypothetical protein
VEFLFVTDLDNTLVGDDRALLELSHKLDRHRHEYGTKIVYATGRSPVLYQKLQWEKNLISPDALVASVGTEIYLDGTENPYTAWSEQLDRGWERDTILAIAAHFADLTLQPDSEQRPYKVSFHLARTVAAELLPQLESTLKQQGLEVKLIYSTGTDLDILPLRGDKGLAVQFLRSAWAVSSEKTVVCGDSGNDISMFATGETKGIIVGNASSELLEWHTANPGDNRYLARARCAGGILEGLGHFGFLG